MNQRQTIIIAFVAIISVVWIYVVEIQNILSTQPKSWSSDPVADCAVVLTGGRYRIQEGIDLLNQKRVKKLIISGVHPDASLKEIFPQWNHYGSMKETDVILEKQSKTTYGNAQQSLQLVEALQCRDIILVTSRLHMYRSLNTFKSVFPVSIGMTENSVVAGRYKFGWLDLLIEATKSAFYTTWVY